jgi:prophage regulatory protein
MHEIHLSDSLLDLPQVRAATKLSRSTVYQKIAAGSFPAPAKIGRSSRWSRQEIEGWIAAKLSERNSAGRYAYAMPK